VAVLIAADLVLAFGTTTPVVLLGTALWGLHMGLTQGVLATLVADTAPAEFRGTDFGIFNLAAGAATLLASLIAGGLWEVFGPQATFVAGAIFSSLALAGMAIVRQRRR
jgi:MFS family permease